MRNWSDVLYETNTETGGLKSTESGFATGSRAFDIDFNRAHSMFLRFLGTIFSSNLGCKRSTFARALETLSSSCRPRNNISYWISNSNYGVVESRLNVSYTI